MNQTSLCEQHQAEDTITRVVTYYTKYDEERPHGQVSLTAALSL